jgi:hypothetical protein
MLPDHSVRRKDLGEWSPFGVSEEQPSAGTATRCQEELVDAPDEAPGAPAGAGAGAGAALAGAGVEVADLSVDGVLVEESEESPDPASAVAGAGVVDSLAPAFEPLPGRLSFL